MAIQQNFSMNLKEKMFLEKKRNFVVVIQTIISSKATIQVISFN